VYNKCLPMCFRAARVCLASSTAVRVVWCDVVRIASGGGVSFSKKEQEK